MSSAKKAAARKKSITVAARTCRQYLPKAAVIMAFAFGISTAAARAEIVGGNCVYESSRDSDKTVLHPVPFDDEAMFSFVIDGKGGSLSSVSGGNGIGNVVLGGKMVHILPYGEEFLGGGDFFVGGNLIKRLECAKDSNSNFNAKRNGEPLLSYFVRTTEAASQIRYDAVTIIIDGGANVNGTDGENNTALHAVAINLDPNYDIARYLLQKGANPNVQNRYADTALHLAVREKNEDVYHAILESGKASLEVVNDRDFTPLQVAIDISRGDYLPLLAAGANPNVKDENGDTPLHHSVMRGGYAISGDLIGDLLAHNADVNSRNNAGDTPLILAIGKCDLDRARILLEAGADAAITNNDGEKAADFGAECEREVAELFGGGEQKEYEEAFAMAKKALINFSVPREELDWRHGFSAGICVLNINGNIALMEDQICIVDKLREANKRNLQRLFMAQTDMMQARNRALDIIQNGEYTTDQLSQLRQEVMRLVNAYGDCADRNHFFTAFIRNHIWRDKGLKAWVNKERCADGSMGNIRAVLMALYSALYLAH